MPTTHTTPIDLRGFHGREFEGVITQADKGYKSKGKISVNDNQEVYCCQNEVNGFNANDKMGFNYSVCVQFQDDSVWNKLFLTSITILDPIQSIDPRWDWKDGEEVHYDAERKKVCRIHKDIVVFVSNGNATGCYTNEEAYKTGYRKLPSPPTRKLTEITEEMFRSTAWYGKKVMYNGVEQGIYSVHYDVNSFTLIQNGEQDYSQCKLIEE